VPPIVGVVTFGCPLLAHSGHGACDAPKLTILRAICDGVTAYPHTARRFSSFIFTISLSHS
jgi:hypothetical protein